MPVITGVTPAISVITQVLQMPRDVPDTLITGTSTSKTTTGLGTLLGYATARSGKSSICKRRSELDHGDLYGTVSRGSHSRIVLLYLESSICRNLLMVGRGQSRH